MFAVIGIVSVVVVGLLGVGFVIYQVEGHAIDRSAKQFADETIPAIVSQWDMGLFERLQSQESRAACTGDKLQKVFDLWRRLGALKKCEGSHSDTHFEILLTQGVIVTSVCRAEAMFERGPATITQQLIRRDGEWQILQMDIHTDSFTPFMDLLSVSNSPVEPTRVLSGSRGSP
jgi:hypothetical protein